MKNSGSIDFKIRKSIYLTKTDYEIPKHELLNESLPSLIIKGISKRIENPGPILHETNLSAGSDRELKKGPNKVVNLPILHQSKNLEVHAGANDSRTIKRTYETNHTLTDNFLNIFALTGIMDEKDSDSHKTVDETDKDTDKSRDSPDIENFQSAISPYPPVEDDEIEKHKHLNAEAEKNSNSKPPPINRQNYLERLKLKRKTLGDQKVKELKIHRRKAVKRTQQRQEKVSKDINELFIEQPPPSPAKPKMTESKPIKLILGFKYSYAIEQYYRGQMRHFGSGLTFLNDNDNTREDVLNGWIVKSLGPTVLNMRARTLPSCNPIELRLRTRMRGNKKSRSSHRTWSRESVKSGMMSKSHDSYSKLNSIEEERMTRLSSVSPRGQKVVISEKVDVIADEVDDNVDEIDKHTELPLIKSCEKMFITAPKIKKEISLKLPAISVDD